ncbi:MAG: cyclic di-GMP phosphodiesterase [Actinomycetota bacterium]|nr:cyclic di-GMP phosphodiesterase [Actinomycetota bacterium]
MSISHATPPRAAPAEISVGQSLLGTLVAIVVPIVLLVALMSARPHLSILTTIGAGIALVVGGSILAGAVWRTSLSHHRLQVVDLFVWSWARRRRSARKISRQVAALQGDSSGGQGPRLTRKEQLKLLTELSAALEANDPYTHGHSRRVARHSYRTALALGFPAGEIENLRRAAQLHDVGKIDVPQSVLQKPGGLTPEERSLMEQHSVYGAEMVSVLQDEEILLAVLHHHERWDGLGYPDGLREDETPLSARVIAVADAFDAITSARPYRKAGSRSEAVRIIRDGRGSQFDPEIADRFLAALPLSLSTLGPLAIFATPFQVFARFGSWLRGLGRDYAPAAVALAIAGLVSAGAIDLPSNAHTEQLAATNAGGSGNGGSGGGANGSGKGAGSDGKGDHVLGKRIKRGSGGPAGVTTTTDPFNAGGGAGSGNGPAGGGGATPTTFPSGGVSTTSVTPPTFAATTTTAGTVTTAPPTTVTTLPPTTAPPTTAPPTTVTTLPPTTAPPTTAPPTTVTTLPPTTAPPTTAPPTTVTTIPVTTSTTATVPTTTTSTTVPITTTTTFPVTTTTFIVTTTTFPVTTTTEPVTTTTVPITTTTTFPVTTTTVPITTTTTFPVTTTIPVTTTTLPVTTTTEPFCGGRVDPQPDNGQDCERPPNR